jgi:pilus assembly protein TadC
LKNPSLYFRRSIWQLSNGIKAGSDVAIVLRSIIDNISAQQKIEIRRYGSKLNPMTLVYMMAAVIIPSLGVTFLIILSTFSGLVVSETMFWMILVFLALFQFMFIGIMKSKRPNII